MIQSLASLPRALAVIAFVLLAAAPSTAQPADDAARLRALFDKEWQWRLR